MGVLKVVEWPAKVLETRAEEVLKFDAELKRFAADMHETMVDAGGIGLASNQVGILKRVITIYIPFQEGEDNRQEVKEPWHDIKYTLVNPEIIKTKDRCTGQEGCLSFPGIYEFVGRHKEIWLKYYDENGKIHEMHASGLFSVCVQHEIDHIDGIVFMDRMSKLKADSVRKKVAKRVRLSKDAL